MSALPFGFKSDLSGFQQMTAVGVAGAVEIDWLYDVLARSQTNNTIGYAKGRKHPVTWLAQGNGP